MDRRGLAVFEQAQARAERIALWVCTAIACGLHGGLAYAMHARAAEPRPLPATEVAFIEPEPEREPEPELEPESEQEPEPEQRPAPEQKPEPERPRAPMPRAAGNVVTADPSAAADAPVRFVTDPNGRGFGSGLVARGGLTTLRPAAPAQPPAPPAALGPRITPPDQLERQPTLLDADCRGHFPAQSANDLGVVAVVALITPAGAIAKLDIESETPSGQGFARAARECLQRQRFAPALDRQGKPALARTRVTIRFSR